MRLVSKSNLAGWLRDGTFLSIDLILFASSLLALVSEHTFKPQQQNIDKRTIAAIGVGISHSS
jgi:hypothetical protein